MFENQLENRLRENAGAIFGQEKELPAGHRERFERRLKERSNRKWKIRLIATVAAAAVIAGFVFFPNLFAAKQQNDEPANVRSYYNMLLKEQAEATRQLIRQVDETHREVLYANVELIENNPAPDVQLPDDEYVILIADFYRNKIERLQNIQDIIAATTTTEFF
ncbi:MAG: hypothetical protein LBE91_12815 [Tannerella sp.]|jgi:hypothetical protein|nr:hypothetical protein [Tannerella sp.]